MRQPDKLLDWYMLIIMLPLTPLLIGKILRDKYAGHMYDKSLTNVLLISGCVWLGFLNSKIDEPEWLIYCIMAVQFVLIGFSFFLSLSFMRTRWRNHP